MPSESLRMQWLTLHLSEQFIECLFMRHSCLNDSVDLNLRFQSILLEVSAKRELLLGHWSVPLIPEILLELWKWRTGVSPSYPSLCPHWEHLEATRKYCDSECRFSWILYRIIDHWEIYIACLYNILEVKKIYSCIFQ